MVTDSDGWKTLVKDEKSQGIVLAVDFDTTGRPEARFADLVANLGPGFEVWESVPPAAGSDYERTGADYVEHWMRRLEAERPPVRALMGFCGGAIYAAALAKRVGELQGTQPPLVLFDPELSTAQTLFWQYHKVIGFLTDVLSTDQITQAREMGQQAYDKITEAVPLKNELMRLMWEFGEPALIAAGLDQTRRAELFGVFDSFLCYLAAASEINPLQEWRSAVAYSSNSPLSGLNAMRTAGVDIVVAQEIPVSTDHGIMLADKDLAARVTDLLNA
ncbi:hypothetical protein [Streptomyces canus]|uniref:hypothetical protein n=1 Tax=Streptomyces canus TaxID=58343 RepID=UPI002E2FC573|nr:hypothetical protein [Streptomyces canus]